MKREIRGGLESSSEFSGELLGPRHKPINLKLLHLNGGFYTL